MPEQAIVVNGMTVVRDEAEALRMMEQNTLIGLDLETSGLSPFNNNIATVQLYGDTTGHVAVLSPRGGLSTALVRLLEDPNKTFVVHNGVGFDLLFLSTHGVDITRAKWYDTMVGECVITTSGRRDVSVSLRNTMKRRLGVDTKGEVDHKSWMNETLTAEQIGYAASDVVALPAIRHAQLAGNTDVDSPSPNLTDALEFEMRLVPVIAGMTLHGMPIDVAKLRMYASEQAVRLAQNQMELNKWADRVLNVGSSKQVTTLFASLGVPVDSSDKETLMGLVHTRPDSQIAHIAQLILDCRYSRQRLNMYSEEWIDEHVVDGRVHPRFWQVGTDTGRFSCSNPNMQQIPRDARSVFGGMGHSQIVGADYSQIEVVISALFTGDKPFIEQVLTGTDIHTYVASQMFHEDETVVTPEQRKLAKAVSFTLLFGGGATTVQSYAASYGLQVDEQSARELVTRFLVAFPGVDRMRRHAEGLAHNSRVVPIRLPNGMKRILTGDKLRSTTILNTVVQGTAAVGIKQALYEAHKAGLGEWLALSVHDEVVCADVPHNMVEEVEATLKVAMLEGMRKTLGVTVKVEGYHGAYWQG